MTDSRRALIMAGGGLKVAYQAGVLQVWLDEADLDFDLADGASGGVLNLAMWCQGMSGTEIADRWREYRPLRAATPNLPALARGPWAASLLSFDGLRKRVLPGFGLDWHAIRRTKRKATFNLFDVTRQEHLVVPPARMNSDLLLSAIALPMWFPPVRSDGDTYIDAVFATDANLEEAIQRGASELWIIWTVSTRGKWGPGFVGQYFMMIEAMANSRLRAVLDRIDRNNAAFDAGASAEFGRRIKVHLIAAEVPVHYLINFRRASMARAVDLGVRDARAWCAKRGIPLRPMPPPAPSAGGKNTARDLVTFHEVMSGTINAEAAPAGPSARLALELDVVVRDTVRFVADPDHVATVHGAVRCPALGGKLPIESGTFNILKQTSPDEKRMIYDLRVTDPGGRALRILGVKNIGKEGWAAAELWPDTTTLYTEVMSCDTGKLIAAGVLRISLPGFLRQLSTFRAAAPTARERASALGRFGKFFVGHLWDVYRSPVSAVPLPSWLRKAATP